MQHFEYVSGEYCSNCLIEAVKAKLKDWPRVKIYFCKPTRSRMFHFMWTDGSADFDFSDNGVNGELPWYKCLRFQGRVRRFKLGFAADYAAYRNGKDVTRNERE